MKLFSKKQVNVAAFLAGPIPAGILFYRNFKTLGEEKKAYITLASTLIFTITFFYALFQIPEAILDKIPGVLFTSIIGVGVYFLFERFMSKEIEEALNSGASIGSNWAVAGLSIIGLIINLSIIFGFALNRGYYEGDILKVNGNELYYDESVTVEDAQKLTKQLKMSDFFGEEYGNIARLQLEGDHFKVTLLVDEQLWKEVQIIDELVAMKWLLETDLGRPTKVILESASFSGKSRYKEI